MYHQDCYPTFTAERNLTYAIPRKKTIASDIDNALHSVYLAILNAPSKVWTSLELVIYIMHIHQTIT